MKVDKRYLWQYEDKSSKVFYETEESAIKALFRKHKFPFSFGVKTYIARADLVDYVKEIHEYSKTEKCIDGASKGVWRDQSVIEVIELLKEELK